MASLVKSSYLRQVARKPAPPLILARRKSQTRPFALFWRLLGFFFAVFLVVFKLEYGSLEKL